MVSVKDRAEVVLVFKLVFRKKTAFAPVKFCFRFLSVFFGKNMDKVIFLFFVIFRNKLDIRVRLPEHCKVFRFPSFCKRQAELS